ncbi:ATP-binding cassette sub-family G member 4-like protein, partial [Dinothrombium tinctorium]
MRANPESNKIQSSDHFSVQWEDLRYRLERPLINVLIDKMLGISNVVRSKTIIREINGEFKSGELTALMGPSGTGKSTLLECIIGKRRIGRSGFVGITGNKKVRIAFIPQQDHFFHLLTVREALIFAFKLQSSTFDKIGQFERIDSIGENERFALENQIVNSILAQLSLHDCEQTRISNLSGGQMKRFSIAQELVVRPDILVLDEPTTGLDSSSCLQTVKMLRELTQQSPPIAIFATIHQPSAKLFKLFHKVYILSITGKFIYNQSPASIHEWLQLFNMNCPDFYNAADFMIEIASGDHGQECIESMAEATIVSTTNEINKNAALLEEQILPPKFRRFYQIMVLTQRQLTYYKRETVILFFRVFFVVFVGSFLAILFEGTGHRGGCPPANIDTLTLENYKDFDKQIIEEQSKVENNLGLFFIIAVFLQFYASLFGIINVIIKIKAVGKEVSNYWYDAFSYFISISLADIPIQFSCISLFFIYSYYFTGQEMQLWRVIKFALIYFAIVYICEAIGMLIASIFAPNLTVSVFIGPLNIIPQIFFSGFLILINNIPSYLRIFANFAHLRFALEGMLITVYGDRCEEGIRAKIEFAKQRVTYFVVTILNYVLDQNEYEDFDAETFEAHRRDVKNLTTILSNVVTIGFEDFVKGDREIKSLVLVTFQLDDHSFALK